ncbi:MAG TPA: mobilization protein [Edaphocola sp.]|jgi:hypothetical protein|nr:mobilization protein [Edaphocola sp.]
MTAEQQTASKTSTRKRGGRPPKAVRKDQLLAFKCSLLERKMIETKAKNAQLSVSEYVREMALNGKISLGNRTLPKEILRFKATLNHLAANLNQVAKKRNRYDVLSFIERAELKVQSEEIKALAKQIKQVLNTKPE